MTIEQIRSTLFIGAAMSSPFEFVWTLVVFVVPLVNSVFCDNSCDSQTCRSRVTSFPGHWPESYCKVTNIVFSTGSQTLRINGDLSELDKCYKVQKIWKFGAQPDYTSVNDIMCDQIFERGHFFTTYYFHGSNYFHLHYDTLIPLFVALQQEETLKLAHNSKDVILLPAVEAQREEGIDWGTDAFMDENSYWMQMLKMMSKSHRFLPLDQKLTGINKTICFREAYFGTPKINYSDPTILHSFASFVKKAFGIKSYSFGKKEKPKVGLIHRDGRRRILNEDQLKKSVESFADVEIVDFSKMTIKEQVQAVQKFAVLIGMNGAGLINALYLPETSVAVQLVPYKAELNVAEFANLLKSRGPYLEWHNTHNENNKSVYGDLFHNGSDTVVNISEFVEVVHRAVDIHRDHILS